MFFHSTNGLGINPNQQIYTKSLELKRRSFECKVTKLVLNILSILVTMGGIALLTSGINTLPVYLGAEGLFFVAIFLAVVSFFKKPIRNFKTLLEQMSNDPDTYPKQIARLARNPDFLSKLSIEGLSSQLVRRLLEAVEPGIIKTYPNLITEMVRYLIDMLDCDYTGAVCRFPKITAKIVCETENSQLDILTIFLKIQPCRQEQFISHIDSSKKKVLFGELLKINDKSLVLEILSKYLEDEDRECFRGDILRILRSLNGSQTEIAAAAAFPVCLARLVSEDEKYPSYSHQIYQSMTKERKSEFANILSPEKQEAFVKQFLSKEVPSREFLPYLEKGVARYYSNLDEDTLLRAPLDDYILT